MGHAYLDISTKDHLELAAKRLGLNYDQVKGLQTTAIVPLPVDQTEELEDTADEGGFRVETAASPAPVARAVGTGTATAKGVSPSTASPAQELEARGTERTEPSSPTPIGGRAEPGLGATAAAAAGAPQSAERSARVAGASGAGASTSGRTPKHKIPTLAAKAAEPQTVEEIALAIKCLCDVYNQGEGHTEESVVNIVSLRYNTAIFTHGINVAQDNVPAIAYTHPTSPAHVKSFFRKAGANSVAAIQWAAMQHKICGTPPAPLMTDDVIKDSSTSKKDLATQYRGRGPDYKISNAVSKERLQQMLLDDNDKRKKSGV